MVHVMAIRSERDAIWQLGLGTNKPLLAAVLLTFLLQMATIYVPALNPMERRMFSLGDDGGEAPGRCGLAGCGSFCRVVYRPLTITVPA
jgi:hypothetical protein